MRGRLAGDALLDVAVGGDHVDRVVEDALAGGASGSSRPRSRRAAIAMPTALPMPWPSGPVVVSTPGGVPVLGVARGQRAPGPQRLQVVQLQAVAGQVELDVEGEAGVARGQHEPVPAEPVRVGRVVAHDPLEEQVGQRRQAHRGAGVAVAGLLHGVHGQHPDDVDRPGVRVGPAVGVRRGLGHGRPLGRRLGRLLDGLGGVGAGSRLLGLSFTRNAPLRTDRTLPARDERAGRTGRAES